MRNPNVWTAMQGHWARSLPPPPPPPPLPPPLAAVHCSWLLLLTYDAMHPRASGDAAASVLSAAAGSQCSGVAAACSAPAALHRLLASSAGGGVEPDQLPLPERMLKDDVEDALHAEAEDVPVADAAEAAEVLAGGGAAQPAAAAAAAGGIASLPLGQGLRQEAAFQGQPWVFETGRLARLANGSCLVQAGGTTVLAAATCQPPPWSRRDALSLQFEVGRHGRERFACQPGGTLTVRACGRQAHGHPAPRAYCMLVCSCTRALPSAGGQFVARSLAESFCNCTGSPHTGGLSREAVRGGAHPLHLQQARGRGQGARSAGGEGPRRGVVATLPPRAGMGPCPCPCQGTAPCDPACGDALRLCCPRLPPHACCPCPQARRIGRALRPLFPRGFAQDSVVGLGAGVGAGERHGALGWSDAMRRRMLWCRRLRLLAA